MEIIGYFRSGIYPQVIPDAMRASDPIPQRQNGTANHFIGNGGFLGIMLRFMTPGCGAIRPGHLGAHDNWMRGLDEGTYLIEAWRCDLATGIFQLGQNTAALLGISAPSCGVIDLVRAYDRKDRPTVLNILEQATASSSSFCFTAMVRAPTSQAAQLICVGRSVLDTPTGEDLLQGVFAFPRERVILCA